MIKPGSDLLSQLTKFYYELEWKDGEALPEHEVRNTIANLILKDRYIVLQDDDGTVLGYLESWRINYEQLGRVMCGESFDVALENISTGNICYVANVVVRPDLQGKTHALNSLIEGCVNQNFMTEHVAWHQRKSKHAPVRVYRTYEFTKKFLREDNDNGLI